MAAFGWKIKILSTLVSPTLKIQETKLPSEYDFFQQEIGFQQCFSFCKNVFFRII